MVVVVCVCVCVCVCVVCGGAWVWGCGVWVRGLRGGGWVGGLRPALVSLPLPLLSAPRRGTTGDDQTLDRAPTTTTPQRPPPPPHATHRVPDLQLDLLAVDVDHARAKLDADREVVHRLEALVRKLQQQARLADARVACALVMVGEGVGLAGVGFCGWTGVSCSRRNEMRPTGV